MIETAAVTQFSLPLDVAWDPASVHLPRQPLRCAAKTAHPYPRKQIATKGQRAA